MKIIIKFFPCALLVTSFSLYPLSYDNAAYAAQKGKWKDAHEKLNSILVDAPDRADVLYDAGVAAYNLGNKCQAATCFARAAECSADKNIAFCAHFNAGNTYVDEKELEQALVEYDKALAIESDNEYARHNRDRVAQMLQEQEKQQENKQDDQQQNKDQEKNEQNQDDKQDQDKQQKDKQDGQQDSQDSSSAEASADRQNQKQNGNDKKDGQQNQNGNDTQNEKNDSSQDELSNKQSQGDSDQRDAANNSKDTQRQEYGKNKKERHQNSTNDKKGDGKNEFDKQSQDAQKEGNEQQRDKHGTTPGQQNISDDKDNLSAQEGQEQAITDPWLLRILNDQEMLDKTVNKQLMEAKIRQHGGKNGQNCW